MDKSSCRPLHIRAHGPDMGHQAIHEHSARMPIQPVYECLLLCSQGRSRWASARAKKLLDPGAHETIAGLRDALLGAPLGLQENDANQSCLFKIIVARDVDEANILDEFNTHLRRQRAQQGRNNLRTVPCDRNATFPRGLDELKTAFAASSSIHVRSFDSKREGSRMFSLVHDTPPGEPDVLKLSL